MKTVIIENLSCICSMGEACAICDPTRSKSWSELCEEPDKYQHLVPELTEVIRCGNGFSGFLSWCKWKGAKVILCDPIIGPEVVRAFLWQWGKEQLVDLTWDFATEAVGIARYAYKCSNRDIMYFTTQPGQPYSVPMNVDTPDLTNWQHKEGLSGD